MADKKEVKDARKSSKKGSSKTAKSGRILLGGGHRKPAKKRKRAERYIPEFLRAKSERSKASWRKRWDRGTAPIGTEGAKYIERTYGPTIAHGDTGGRSGSRSHDSGGGVVTPDRRSVYQDYYPEDEVDDFDVYDDFDFYDREY